MTAFVSGSHSCGGCGVALGRIVSSTWVLGQGASLGHRASLNPGHPMGSVLVSKKWVLFLVYK